jgi:hypothetical protein
MGVPMRQEMMFWESERFEKYIAKLDVLVIDLPVTVAVRSEAWVLAGWLLGSWVRILLKEWMFVRVFLYCVVLCR